MHQTANNFNARQQSKGGAMQEDETLYADNTTVVGPQHNTIPINPYIAHVNKMESNHL